MTAPKHRLKIFAHGGEVITSRSRFMKTQDPFRTDIQRQDYGARKDPLADPSGDTKRLKPVKPHVRRDR
jgi:hypothetical protein